jgi:hypothetical protein
MSTYVWKDGGFVCKRTGEPMQLPERGELACPAVQSDIEPYRSPVGDHALVGGRAQQREDLKRHDCVLRPPREKQHLKNPRFAKKYGLEHRLER